MDQKITNNKISIVCDMNMLAKNVRMIHDSARFYIETQTNACKTMDDVNTAIRSLYMLAERIMQNQFPTIFDCIPQTKDGYYTRPARGVLLATTDIVIMKMGQAKPRFLQLRLEPIPTKSNSKIKTYAKTIQRLNITLAPKTNMTPVFTDPNNSVPQPIAHIRKTIVETQVPGRTYMTFNGIEYLYIGYASCNDGAAPRHLYTHMTQKRRESVAKYSNLAAFADSLLMQSQPISGVPHPIDMACETGILFPYSQTVLHGRHVDIIPENHEYYFMIIPEINGLLYWPKAYVDEDPRHDLVCYSNKKIDAAFCAAFGPHIKSNKYYSLLRISANQQQLDNNQIIQNMAKQGYTMYPYPRTFTPKTIYSLKKYM